MNKLTDLGKPFTASQLTVLAGVPNEYALQVVNELGRRQLVKMQAVTGGAPHATASGWFCNSVSSYLTQFY